MQRVMWPAILFLMAACEPAEEGAGPDAAARPAKVAVVSAAASSVEYSYPAVVLPALEAELSFRVSGQIMDLPVRAMSQVSKGDLIARIDARDFTSNVAQIEAQRSTARAQLRQLTAGARSEDIGVIQANIDAAQAQVEEARSQAKATLTLYRKGVESKAAMDGKLAALKVAEAQLNSARQELAKGRSGATREEVDAQLATIAGLDAQLQSARDTRGDATLVAPFDGIVAERSVENFANVQAGQTIAVVQNLASVDLNFDVPGPDVARLGQRQGLQNFAILDALPGRRFPAELIEFSTRADPTTQTFRGRVTIERPDDAVILPGMAGRLVVIDSGAQESALSVPLTALASSPEGASFVWVVGEDNTVTRREVKTGEVVGDAILIVEGLTDGEKVVTAGIAALQPGMAIRPVTQVGG